MIEHSRTAKSKSDSKTIIFVCPDGKIFESTSTLTSHLITITDDHIQYCEHRTQQGTLEQTWHKNPITNEYDGLHTTFKENGMRIETAYNNNKPLLTTIFDKNNRVVIQGKKERLLSYIFA